VVGSKCIVAKHRLYVVKRMSDTGHEHHARRVSYEPELGQSGPGELIGEAIIERPPELIELRGLSAFARVGEDVRKGCRARTGRHQCAMASDEPACRHVLPVRARGRSQALQKMDTAIRLASRRMFVESLFILRNILWTE
jgi:hypothetical protein